MSRASTARGGSLQRGLGLVVAATAAGVVILVSLLTWFVVAGQLQTSLDTALDREATRVQRLIQANADWTGENGSDCRYAVEPACVARFSASDPVGSGSGPLRVTEAAHAVATGEATSTRSTVDGVRVVAVPTRDGEAVLVGIPTGQTDLALQRAAIAFGATGLLGVALAGLVGYLVAGFALRPVRRLDAAVHRIRTTADPHDRVELHPGADTELDRLAASFNDMLDELAAASDAQRDFVADASHELRTPLTTLRTNTELLTGDRPIDAATAGALRQAVAEEIVAMQAIIEDLGELARGDRAARAELVVEDLGSAAESAVVDARRRWPATEFRVDAVAAPVHVAVPPNRLPRLLNVLLDNAGQYGAGAPVDVVVSVERADGGAGSGSGADPVAVLEVRDRGIGIPAEERERVFERFHRAPASRGLPGSGLGLAIAAQIVAAAGGSIAALGGVGTRAGADSAPDAPGATIRVELPVGRGPALASAPN